MKTGAISEASAVNVECSLHDWMNLRSELLFIVDSAIPAGDGDRSGGREREFSAWLVRRGWARIESEGEKAEARAGEWLICSGRSVTQRFSPDAHLLAMRVSQSWPDGSALFAGGVVTVLKAAKHPGLERNARRLQGLVEKLRWAGEKEGDPRAVFQWRTRMNYRTYAAYQRHLQAWLLALVDGLEAKGRRVFAPESGDPRVAKACQLLDTLPAGATYPEDALVAASGLTIGRLNQVFARAYGVTTHAYWERRRLERARKALEGVGATVKQIAFEAGFSQLSHFSRWFKHRAGVGLRAYRERSGAAGMAK